MMKRKAQTDISSSSTRPNKKICPDILPSLPPISDDLATLVFTHPSAAATSTKPETNIAHYDRLEFLGDAYIEVIASELIFDTYKTANAGRMAQIRQQLVQNETLAQYSIAYGFDKKLKISIPPDKVSKTPFVKIHGDVFEAYVGAVFRSDPKHGPAAAEKWLKDLWAPHLKNLQEQFPDEVLGMKEELNRRIVVPGIKLDYLEERPVVVHKGKGTQTYTMGVYLTGWNYQNQHLGSGKAGSKSQAGQEAAKSALANPLVQDKLTGLKDEYIANKQI